MQLYRYTTKYVLHKICTIKRAMLDLLSIMARLLNAAQTIFGPPGICKREGLLLGPSSLRRSRLFLWVVFEVHVAFPYMHVYI